MSTALALAGPQQAPAEHQATYPLARLTQAQCRYLACLSYYNEQREALEQSGVAHNSLRIWRRNPEFRAAELQVKANAPDWGVEAARAIARRVAPLVLERQVETALMQAQTGPELSARNTAAQTILKAAGLGQEANVQITFEKAVLLSVERQRQEEPGRPIWK